MPRAATDSAPTTLSVTQLNRQVKRLLEGHFDYVWVEGEISNLATPASGHWYFSLKDGQAQVRCAMFRGHNQRLRFRPGNGDAVRLRARVSLYEGRGDYQLIVEFMEPAGSGALQLAFERLKAKLAAEGLFEHERKRPLPESVRHLGVVTSPSGAAIHDILTVLARRSPAIEVSLLPVAVQGEAAAAGIAAAIDFANRLQAGGQRHFDALIVGRGGGSLEDLWAFNEESVARAIAASSIPIVSAVGHEVDFSIADMVADYRAPTPSAAAEHLSPDAAQQRAHLATLEHRLRRQTRQSLSAHALQLRNLRHRLQHPGQRLREQAQRLDDLEQRLLAALRLRLQAAAGHVRLLDSRLQANSPLLRIQTQRQQLEAREYRLRSTMTQGLRQRRERLAGAATLLDSLSPLRVLQRGYSILTDTAGTVVRNAAEVDTGSELKARLQHGNLTLQVTGIDAE